MDVIRSGSMAEADRRSEMAPTYYSWHLTDSEG